VVPHYVLYRFKLGYLSAEINKMAPRAVDDGLSKKVVGLEAVVVLEDDLKLLHAFSYRARCLHLKEQLMHCFLNYRYTSLNRFIPEYRCIACYTIKCVYSF